MAGTPSLWFRRTYRLPPTDERYLSSTIEDITTEYLAYHYDDLHRKGKLDDLSEDDSFDQTLEDLNDDDFEDVTDDS